MRAGDAAWLLDAIAKSQQVELTEDQGTAVDGLARRGLIRPAPDAGPERARLAELRETLVQIGRLRTSGLADPSTVARERALRTQILDLSERVAASEGATVLRSVGGSPYRGGVGLGSRVQLTQVGRALLGDLRPRVARVEHMPLEAFEGEMYALRSALDTRAYRAAEVLARMSGGAGLGPARNPVAVGLAMMRTEPAQTVDLFVATLGRVRRVLNGLDPQGQIAAAECLCLSAENPLDAPAPERIQSFGAIVFDLQRRFRVGTEDALDTAALLGSVPAALRERRLSMAQELASKLRVRGRQVSLAYALIALAGYDALPEFLSATLAGLDETLARELTDPTERMATAVLIAFPQTDVRAHIPRWRTLRQYLSRVSPEGMAVEAAFLAWLSPAPEEILDDLRLASLALSKHGVAGSGAETVTTAAKLLLGMASMAAGREGDLEEGVAFTPRAPAGLSHLGLSGALAALPLAAVQAFHHTVLQAASAWESTYHPTHSSYVFGRTSRGHYRG